MRFLLSTSVVLAAAAGVAVSAHGDRAAPREGRLELIASVRHIAVKGVAVSGLYPGAVKSLTVTVSNSQAFTIKVASLSTTVVAPTDSAGCTGKPQNLVVTAPKATVKLRARKTHRYVVKVTMPKTVANACQGAKFKITVKVHATR
jgi:hypothetical protein